jgi:pyruvate dehydrogenase E2 component (dihydrolipoamide acetyltransferase)
MSIPITIPRLGWNMEEGVFGGWLKQDGDTIQPGDRLFVLESEKAAEEIECLDAGTLSIPTGGPKTGDKLAVGAVIGYILSKNSAPPPAPVHVSRAPEPVASPSVRRLAREQGIDLQKVKGSGPGGRITSEDLNGSGGGTPLPAVASTSDGSGVRSPRISPRARRLADRLGLDWKSLKGSGSTGRIRECDVEAAASTSPSTGRLIPIITIRRTIATRMVESLRNTAPVTLTTTVDATNLVNLREQFKASGDAVPSYTDFLVRLCASALGKHPMLTARWTDEGLRLPEAIHIGVAVDTEAGLLVPVIRNVGQLGLRDLARVSRDLIDRTRQGKLAASDMQGGCFTISSLGSFGIDAFTPIINYPETAILGVGRIAKRPWVVGDAVVPRDVLTLSLTFDHRVVDGAPAARFLQTLSRAIENPAPWLTT